MGLKNPIPEMAKDKGQLVKLFEQGKFLVPYSRNEKGKTAHSTLNMLYTLAQLSPIKKSVMASKIDFCFSKGITDENTAFIENLTAIGVSADDVVGMVGASMRDESICGTAFVKLSLTSVNGVFSAKITRIPPQNALPAYDWDNQDSDFNNLLFYTDKPIGNDYSMQPGKLMEWKAAGLFPKWTKRGKVVETVFQINAVGYDQEIWGRPVVDPNLLLIDYETANNVAKISASEVTAKVMMLLKEPSVLSVEGTGKSVDDVKRELTFALRNRMTNRGDQSESLGVLFYTDEAPTVETININRDSQWLETTRKMCVQSICAAEGIPASLASLEDLKVGLGGNVVLDTLILTNAKTIEPTQSRYAKFFNTILNALAEKAGIEGGKIAFINPMIDIIEQFKAVRQTNSNANQANTNQTGGSN